MNVGSVAAATILRSGALVGILVALTGCGSADMLDVQLREGTTALVSTSTKAGSDAEVRGVIQVGPGGCLGLVSEGTTHPTPLIWPKGSKLTQAGDAVDVPGLGVVRIGQTVHGGGGEVTSPSGDRYADIPAGCLDQGTLIEATTIKTVT